MGDRRFPILGGTVPPMLGREPLLQEIVGALTKRIPDHLQVVGPRFAGKTVILHELARRLREKGAPYCAVVLWDLGHQTPVSDELFMQRFSQKLAEALAPKHPDFANHLELHSKKGNPYQEIAAVLELLEGESKVLAIFDGFDKPLRNGQLTRNLWDQLRELASKPSLRFVTASRRTLRDLIRDPDSQTSDFWNIFAPGPVRVGCFDDDDISVLAQLGGLKLAPGAKTELLNETNGFPPVLLEVLNVLQEGAKGGEVTPQQVLDASEKAMRSVGPILETLWVECGVRSQDLLVRVLEEGSVACAGVSGPDAAILVERGFVAKVGNKLQRPCGLLRRLLNDQPHEGNALARLFGSAEAYQQNFRGVMERRLAHLSGINSTLRSYLQRGVEDLPKHPELFLSDYRGLLDQAFELIWEAEIGARRIPGGWMSIWKLNEEQRIRDWETTFPQGAARLRLLQLMTGTDKSVACAKFVTKNTYVLMSAAYTFGEFGQHREGVTIDPGTAYVALTVCMELIACLSRELAGALAVNGAA